MQTVTDLITQVDLQCPACTMQSTAVCLPCSDSWQTQLVCLPGKSVPQIRSGFSLLGGIPSLYLELDGYSILEGSSLDLFRDGDVVVVKATQAALPLGQPEGTKMDRSEGSLPAFTAGKWLSAAPVMFLKCRINMMAGKEQAGEKGVGGGAGARGGMPALGRGGEEQMGPSALVSAFWMICCATLSTLAISLCAAWNVLVAAINTLHAHLSFFVQSCGAHCRFSLDDAALQAGCMAWLLDTFMCSLLFIDMHKSGSQ